MYQQYKIEGQVFERGIRRLSDGACIPFDPDNTDAQEFCKWLLAGNKPEPAEEGGIVTDEWVTQTIDKLYNNRS